MISRIRNRVRSPRRGVVLLAVLLIVVVLSLAAYEYSEWVNSEYRAADAFARAAQAQSLADSGVHYVAAMLANSDAMTNTLNGNPFDNSQAFQNIVVLDNGSGPRGMFTILSLRNPDDPDIPSQAYRIGVADEAGKINVNALLAYDGGKGDVGFQILMLLPNMTEDVANSILDWIDPDDTSRSDGAEEDYYSSLTPAYHCKNGPIDSLEELLLVKGVTPQLLFGNDRNRNGVLDPDEDDGSGQVDLGWSAYLTVYSHEPNTDFNGNPRIYLNDPDINTLAENLTTALGADMANYIIAYRLYGPAAATAIVSATVSPNGAVAVTAVSAPAAADATTQPYSRLSDADDTAVKSQLTTARATASTQKPQNIKSIYDLIGSKVSVATGSGRTAKTISLPCPLNDPGQLKQLLPLVLDETTTTQNTDLTPAINVNTASETVLSTVPGLTATDVQTILSTRPDPSADQTPDPIFQTPAWLLTEANISQATLKAIAPYVTARSKVYRFQAFGFFEGGNGPTARVEAVVDANNSRARIVYYRPLTAVGSGFDPNTLGQ